VKVPLKANWSYPTTVWAGPGRIKELPAACERLGIRRPLLVTDEGLRDAPMVRQALSLLPGSGLYAGVRGNPVAANIEGGLAVYRQGAYDGVIALGGGSALDAGKVIAFMSGQTRPLWDFEDVGDWWRRADRNGIAPIVAVPTTAGTGSEVGRAGVVINEATQQKKIIFHPQMMPGVVISDPELTVGLPPKITAATGMDAFAHCFEAFCAPGFHPMADGIALEGLRLIQAYLPRAYENGSDIEARSRMLAAASMGATAFQKGLGGVHAIAHPVGAHFNTHHGLTNAVLLPYLLVHNHQAIEPRLAVIARTLNLPGEPFAALFDWLLGFRRRLGVPNSLADLGVTLANPETIGEEAAHDPCAAGNPLPTDAAGYTRIFRSAVTGDLTLGGVASPPA
jgi:alcohol dehydrogenase class IV